MKRSGKLITIVRADDDSDDREMTLEAFAEGYLANQVDVVGDGEELMDSLLRRDKYASKKDDLLPGRILLDLNMSRKDGREAFRRFRESAGKILVRNRGASLVRMK